MTLTAVELDQGEPIPPLEAYDFMVVMGGPMDVWQEDQHPWLIHEKAAIRRWVRQLNRPYLGVCLGHQLLADALGGTVGLMPKPEIGVMEIALTPDGIIDPVFSRLRPVIHGLQWHGAQVFSLPADGTVLATNEHCAMQAIRIGACAWGVQFHLEVDETTMAEWEAVPEYRRALEDAGHGGHQWLSEAVSRHAGTMDSDASALLSGVVGMVRSDVARRQALVQ